MKAKMYMMKDVKAKIDPNLASDMLKLVADIAAEIGTIEANTAFVNDAYDITKYGMLVLAEGGQNITDDIALVNAINKAFADFNSDVASMDGIRQIMKDVDQVMKDLGLS